MSDLPQHMPKREVYSEGLGCCGYILLFFSILLYLPVLPLAIASSLKMVNSYERAVIFRLGQMVAGGEASEAGDMPTYNVPNPGLFCIVPCIDTYTKVDMRTLSYDVPPQEILTKDFVTVAVDAVVYYRIFDAYASITAVHDVNRSTRLLAQTALRNVLGTMALAQILSHREEISNQMQMSLDHATDPWGVKVERVEVKDVRLPVSLQRAMAAEAEATREAKAKIVAAKGEQTASKALLEAAQIIAGSPEALQLRYLQTLTGISGKNNSTIVFPVPRNLLKSFGKPTTQMAVA